MTKIHNRGKNQQYCKKPPRMRRHERKTHQFVQKHLPRKRREIDLPYPFCMLGGRVSGQVPQKFPIAALCLIALMILPGASGSSIECIRAHRASLPDFQCDEGCLAEVQDGRSPAYENAPSGKHGMYKRVFKSARTNFVHKGKGAEFSNPGSVPIRSCGPHKHPAKSCVVDKVLECVGNLELHCGRVVLAAAINVKGTLLLVAEKISGLPECAYGYLGDQGCARPLPYIPGGVVVVRESIKKGHLSLGPNDKQKYPLITRSLPSEGGDVLVTSKVPVTAKNVYVYAPDGTFQNNGHVTALAHSKITARQVIAQPGSTLIRGETARGEDHTFIVTKEGIKLTGATVGGDGRNDYVALDGDVTLTPKRVQLPPRVECSGGFFEKCRVISQEALIPSVLLGESHIYAGHDVLLQSAQFANLFSAIAKRAIFISAASTWTRSSGESRLLGLKLGASSGAVEHIHPTQFGGAVSLTAPRISSISGQYLGETISITAEETLEIENPPERATFRSWELTPEVGVSLPFNVAGITLTPHGVHAHAGLPFQSATRAVTQDGNPLPARALGAHALYTDVQAMMKAAEDLQKFLSSYDPFSAAVTYTQQRSSSEREGPGMMRAQVITLQGKTIKITGTPIEAEQTLVIHSDELTLNPQPLISTHRMTSTRVGYPVSFSHYESELQETRCQRPTLTSPNLQINAKMIHRGQCEETTDRDVFGLSLSENEITLETETMYMTLRPQAFKPKQNKQAKPAHASRDVAKTDVTPAKDSNELRFPYFEGMGDAGKDYVALGKALANLPENIATWIENDGPAQALQLTHDAWEARETIWRRVNDAWERFSIRNSALAKWKELEATPWDQLERKLGYTVASSLSTRGAAQALGKLFTGTKKAIALHKTMNGAPTAELLAKYSSDKVPDKLIRSLYGRALYIPTHPTSHTPRRWRTDNDILRKLGDPSTLGKYFHVTPAKNAPYIFQAEALEARQELGSIRKGVWVSTHPETKRYGGKEGHLIFALKGNTIEQGSVPWPNPKIEQWKALETNIPLNTDHIAAVGIGGPLSPKATRELVQAFEMRGIPVLSESALNHARAKRIAALGETIPRDWETIAVWKKALKQHQDKG